MVGLSWTLCGACVAGTDEDPSADAETTDESEGSGSSASSSSSSSSSSSASTGVDEGGSSSSGEPGDEDGPIDEEACIAEPDAGPSSFALDVGDWPIEDDFYSGTLEGSCTVTSVTVSADLIATVLECMDGDAGPYVVTFDVAAASGAPTWAANDEVDLHVSANDDQGGIVDEPAGPTSRTFVHTAASLRRPSDGALLVAGVSGAFGFAGVFAPLELTSLGGCWQSEEGCGDDVPLQYTLREGDGEPIVLTGGHHAELPLADGTTLVIDLPRAHLGDCHFGESFRLAARRMAD